ncbi:hypothetical protein GOP47_0006861 [Adiantum capillus-veneris]|uniref:Uncharacterized protein n=1 Tax=Adiantum capillus-veneris TaxID=13818 RepID=A0A9D4V480_ADICA|nr:hypothetical protein GOP47_0006861 [Adiantum capillus-veneris]
MEAFLSPSWYPNPFSHSQSTNEVYSSLPYSLLLNEQGFDRPFTPSSPSLDMEAALRHLSSTCESELSASSNSFDEPDAPFTPSSPSLDMEAALQHLSTSSCDSELSSSPVSVDDPDVLMVDPFLDYLNEVLMEEQGEGGIDVSCMRQDVEASYNAIVSSLYDIIGECSPLDSTSSKSSLTRESQVSNNTFFAYCGSDVSLGQEKAGKSSSHAHKGPFETAHTGEGPVVGGISFLRFNGVKAQDQEQTSNFDLLLPNDDKSNTKPSSVEISFEELNVNADYADLYVGKPSLPETSTTTGKATKLNGSKKNTSRAARKGGQSVRNASAEVGGFVDLRELLVSCAQAVAMGDVKKASEILRELYQDHGVSGKGNGLQRTAHYFCDALVARMGGRGGHKYRTMCENMPSMVSFLRPLKMWYGVSPYMKLMYYFANQNILKSAEGASRLHILDYGIFYGLQWPCLINALADRAGGPPLLIITGIDCSKPGLNSLEWLQGSGRRLAAYARTYNVPFRFHAIVSDHWDDIDPASLHLHESEVLVINCMKCLRHHADESVNSSLTIAPRQKLLMSMRSLNPHLLLVAEINSASNSPFFVSRFREALYLYSNMMDMLDTLWSDDEDRLVVESRTWARDILNIVACEGAERVERPETYRQWNARIKRAGFELQPIPSVILSRSRSYVKQHHHKDFFVLDDANGWMLLGWKGRVALTMSAWKPYLLTNSAP